MTMAHAAGGWGVVRDGLRTTLFLRPLRRDAVVGLPTVLGLGAALLLLAVLGARVGNPGAARLSWPSFDRGLLGPLLVLFVCWLVTRARPGRAEGDPDTTTVLAWLAVQALVIGSVVHLVRLGFYEIGLPPRLPPLFWLNAVRPVALLWWLVAASVALMPLARSMGARLAVLTLLGVVAAAVQGYPFRPAWIRPPAPSAAVAPPPPLTLTQDALEAQSRTLVEALDAIEPQRPGVTDLYALTFAPYADEDVFSREVKMVGAVMRERFDTAGRQMNLQNHASTLATAPWATPLNLRRAIGRMAERMDVHEDILFLHLTSHGARNGRLAADFEPLEVDEVTPTDLRRWLDDAGVRYAVISISACFSGSWIPALEAPGTLVLTAADATHTSYGCGRKSELTFFGRAMYDEQLRTTRSFEAAFAAALPVIDRREKEAGKSDGPSNPQMRMGAEVRPRLEALVKRLEQN